MNAMSIILIGVDPNFDLPALRALILVVASANKYIDIPISLIIS